MALRLRSSKFRHVYGAQCRREQIFENVRITRNTHDSNFCSVNPRFLAIVTESSGGGSFVVLDVNMPGRVDINCPRVCGHEGAVMDIKWNPFDDCIIASGSDDATVKIWTVPESGIFGTITNWSADLHGHTRRVGYIEWHTTAANVLMSVGFDFKIMIWNVEQAEPITSLDCHQDTIFSVSWGKDGSLIASTCKDKQIRIMDPRTARVAMKTDGHQSGKASKISFVTENQVFTTGFSRISDRQYALWDIRKAGTPLVIEDLDSSSGILLPYYDTDTKIMYLAGKGDGNIRYFEIEDGSVQFLNTYQSSQPQRGLGMMPKRGIDPFKNEVARFYKLHASKNVVEPVSMIVPRKAEGFQPDVFPPTASLIPSLTADEWTSGINRGPILVDLQSGAIQDKPKSSMSPAVVPQIPALSKPPQITTCKAINRAPPASFNASPTSFSPAPFTKQTSPSSLRTSPEGHAQVFMGSPSQKIAANQMFGSVNWRDRSHQEPASVKNIKCLSMSKEDKLDSDSSHLLGQALSPASSVPSSLSRALISPGSSLSSFVSPPPLSSTSSTHHLNGFAGHSSTDEHHPAVWGSNIASAASTSDIHTGVYAPSKLPPVAHPTHIGHYADVQPRFTPTVGGDHAGMVGHHADEQPRFSPAVGVVGPHIDVQPRFTQTAGEDQASVVGPHTDVQPRFTPTVGVVGSHADVKPRFTPTAFVVGPHAEVQPRFIPTAGVVGPHTDVQPRFTPAAGLVGPHTDVQPRFTPTAGVVGPHTEVQPRFTPTAGVVGPHTEVQPRFAPTAGVVGPHTEVQPRFAPAAGVVGPLTEVQPRFTPTVSADHTSVAVQPRFTPTVSADHTNAGSAPLSAAASTSQTNTIHVRKVWAPPVQSAVSMYNITAPYQSGVTSPGSDLELKKAYFRQLEEIRSLQEQLEVKDRRIKQLESELYHFREETTDLKRGESKC